MQHAYPLAPGLAVRDDEIALLVNHTTDFALASLELPDHLFRAMIDLRNELVRTDDGGTNPTLREVSGLSPADCEKLGRRLYVFLTTTLIPPLRRRELAHEAITDFSAGEGDRVCDLPEAIVVALLTDLDGPIADRDDDDYNYDYWLNDEPIRETEARGHLGTRACPTARSGTTYHLCGSNRTTRAAGPDPGLWGSMSRISHKLVGPVNWKAATVGLPLISATLMRNRMLTSVAHQGRRAFTRILNRLPKAKAPLLAGAATGVALIPTAAQAAAALAAGTGGGNDTDTLPAECWTDNDPPDECCQGESPPEACCDAARLPLPENCPDICLGPSCTLPGPDCEARPCPDDWLCCPLELALPGLNSHLADSPASSYATAISDTPTDWEREFQEARTTACNLPLGEERDRALDHLVEIGNRRSPPMTQAERNAISCDGVRIRPHSTGPPRKRPAPLHTTWHSMPNLTAGASRRRRHSNHPRAGHNTYNTTTTTRSKRRKRSPPHPAILRMLTRHPDLRRQLHHQIATRIAGPIALSDPLGILRRLHRPARNASQSNGGARRRRAVPDESVYLLAGHDARNPACTLLALNLAEGLDHAMRTRTATHMRFTVRTVDKVQTAGTRWLDQRGCKVWETVRATFTFAPATPTGAEEVESLRGYILHPATGKPVPRDPASLAILTEAVRTTREDDNLMDLETLVKCMSAMDTDEDRRRKRQAPGVETGTKTKQPPWSRLRGKPADSRDRLALGIQNSGVQCGATTFALAVILHRALREYHNTEGSPDATCHLRDLIAAVDGVHWMTWERSLEGTEPCAVWPGVRTLLRYREDTYSPSWEGPNMLPMLRRILDDEADETRPVEHRLVRLHGRIPPTYRKHPALNRKAARRLADLLEDRQPWELEHPTGGNPPAQPMEEDAAETRGEKRTADPDWDDDAEAPAAKRPLRQEAPPSSSSYNYIRPKQRQRKGTPRPRPRLMPDPTKTAPDQTGMTTPQRFKRTPEPEPFAIAALVPLITGVALGMAKPLAATAVSSAVAVGVGMGLNAAAGTKNPNSTTTARRKRSMTDRLITRLLNSTRQKRNPGPDPEPFAFFPLVLLNSTRQKRSPGPDPEPFAFIPLVFGPGLSAPLGALFATIGGSGATAGIYQLTEHVKNKAMETTPSPPPATTPFSAPAGNLSFLGVTGRPFTTPPSLQQQREAARSRVLALLGTMKGPVRLERREAPDPEQPGEVEKKNKTLMLQLWELISFAAAMDCLPLPRYAMGHPPESLRDRYHYRLGTATDTGSHHREKRGLGPLATLTGLLAKYGPKLAWTVGKNALFGVATAGAGVGIHAIVQSQETGYDYSDELSANIGIPCWKECSATQGFCPFCGSEGKCCRLGWPGRGCNGLEGVNDTHVCTYSTTSNIQDAYNLILVTDAALREMNGTEHRDHRQFLHQLYGRHQLHSGGIDEQALLREYIRGYGALPLFKNSPDFQAAVTELDDAIKTAEADTHNTRGTGDPTPQALRAPKDGTKSVRVRVPLSRPRRVAENLPWDPLRFPQAEASSPTDRFHLWQRLIHVGRHRRDTTTPDDDKLTVYTIINRVCEKKFPELYRDSLTRLTYLCSIENPWEVDGLTAPRPPPTVLPNHGPRRTTRSVRPVDLVLTNATFTGNIARRLGGPEIPAAYWSLLIDYLLAAARSPQHAPGAVLVMADGRMRGLGESLGERTATPASPRMRKEADDFIIQLQLDRLLDRPCKEEETPDQRTVTYCEEKFARVTAYLAQDLTRVTLPEDLVTRRIAIWTADDDQLSALSRQRRDDQTPPEFLLCEGIARLPSYPKPLLTLALSRCLGPHRQVMSILHYLSDQANLLALNRHHIQWKNLPPAPGGVDRTKQPTAQRPRKHRSWDLLQFPGAEAAIPTARSEHWPQWTYGGRTRRDTRSDTEPPRTPTLHPIREPQLIHKAMGTAAVDIVYKPLPIAIDLEPMEKTLHTVSRINDMHLRDLARKHRISVPPPTTWRTERPDLPPELIPILNVRERAIRLGRRLGHLKAVGSPRENRWPRSILSDQTELDVVNNFVFSPVPQATAVRAHRAADHPLISTAQLEGAAKTLLPAAQNIFTTLRQTMKDIHATATRPQREEKWDAHELNTDALLQVETALDAASQFVASATHGSLHPEQVYRIDRADLRKLNAEEATKGYEPLLRSRFELTTAPTTVAAIRVNGEVRRLQVLVWLPYVHKSGRMTAYSVVPAPVPMGEEGHVTLAPDQDRIILVSRHGRTELSWTTLSATEFAACRPAGTSITCPSMGTLRPPIEDQAWPRQDADVCAYALHARKPQLALTACTRRPVHEHFTAHRLGPFSWVVFSQGVTTPQYDCPGVDPTRAQQIRGLAILRLPARCRALADGWELIADDSSAAAQEPAVFTDNIVGLPAALGRLQRHDRLHPDDSSAAMAGYEYYRTGPPPTDPPPLGFIFGDTEATSAILGLIIVLLLQAVTNAVLFCHFRTRFRTVRHELTRVLLGEEEETNRDGITRLTTVIHRIYARLEYTEAMVVNMCAALQRAKLRFQQTEPPPASVYRTTMPGAPDVERLTLLA